MRAGVHPQGAADCAGNAAEEFEACDPGLGRDFGDGGVRRGGAGDDLAIFASLDRAKGFAAEAQDETGKTAVANDQIRTKPNRSCAGPPTRNQVKGASGAFAASRPRRAGLSERTSRERSGNTRLPGRQLSR
jgi:hypothetical protein